MPLYAPLWASMSSVACCYYSTVVPVCEPELWAVVLCEPLCTAYLTSDSKYAKTTTGPHKSQQIVTIIKHNNIFLNIL